MPTTVQPFYSAMFYSTDNGATVRRRVNPSENQMNDPSGTPANTTNIYRFDHTQSNNAALLSLWAVDSTRFTMSGNTVLVDGQTAGFDAPGLLFRALQNAATLYAKAESTPDAFTREEEAQLYAISFRAIGLVSF